MGSGELPACTLHGQLVMPARSDCRCMSQPPPPCRARRSLSDFQLTKQLYKGKASTLYLAVDKPSGMTVALKSYSKRRLSTLNWHQVEREVRLHAQLRHPSIIALHAAFEDDNYVFMVTEYAEGEAGGAAGRSMQQRWVATCKLTWAEGNVLHTACVLYLAVL